VFMWLTHRQGLIKHRFSRQQIYCTSYLHEQGSVSGSAGPVN